MDQLYTGKYVKISDVRVGLTSAASLYDYTVGDTYTDDKVYIKEFFLSNWKWNCIM